ncbi:MAG TPA: DivIVA domain-containing protein [Pilimelia sp.]|nr:DivIVA domain-containing protein [Pilimelia sp.]
MTLLTARDLRGVRFAPAGRRREGLDAAQVYALLARLAAELELLHGQLGGAAAENHRIKTALRDWQERHAACCRHESHWPAAGQSPPATGPARPG